jgi:diacylglycerol kinase family enzyme
MADTEVASTSGKSSEQEKVGKEFTITLPATDPTFEVIAHLQENQDAIQIPRLIKVSKIEHDKLPSPSTLLLREPKNHIVISTGSGHQKASHFYDDVVFPILCAAYPPSHETSSVHTTQSATDVSDLTRDIFFPAANAGTAQLIILLSGDGGIVDLINGLLITPASPSYVAPRVVLVPLGTANALYHSIHPSQSNTWGLKALTSTTTQPLPLFTTSFSPGARLLVDEARATEELPRDSQERGVLHGAVVCSWGMHASLVADSDTAEYRKFGVERFKMAAKEALYPSDGSAPHAYKAKVSVLKGEKWEDFSQKEHMYVLSTMVSHLESSFNISPASKPLDGSMHLVHFGPTTGDEAMRIMGLAYQGGKHVEDAKVRYEEIDGLRIAFEEEDERWRRVCVDGKIVKVESGGWVEIRKRVGSVVNVVVAAD